MEQHEAVQKWDKQMSGMDWPITKPNTTSRGHVTFRLNKGLTIPILSLFQFQCILEVCKTVSFAFNLKVIGLYNYLIFILFFNFGNPLLIKKREVVDFFFIQLFIHNWISFKFQISFKKKNQCLTEKKKLKKQWSLVFIFPFK